MPPSRFRSRTLGVLVAFLVSAIPVVATAQQSNRRPQGPAADEGRLLLQSAPLDGSIQIDGRIDEDAWQNAPVATGFVQWGPQPGAPATQRTVVRVLHGADALYVAARMYDTAPDSIAAPLMRRDGNRPASDWFDVIIDSHHDLRTAFRFGVNPRGVRRDVYHFNDSSEDGSWNAVWEVATLRDSLGWTAEFRIPYAQLRFGAASGARVWGINFSRNIARHGELAFWAPALPHHGGFVSRAGELHGLDGITPPRRFDVMPYASARTVRERGAAANPFYQPSRSVGAVGIDLRYGVTPTMTLTATANPDFGQVEADPAVVNLTAFETFFQENRPFFSEGADLFRFGQLQTFINITAPQLFYSRRIGRSPQRQLAPTAAVPFVDVPAHSTILGAAKLTGRQAGGWSIGALNAVTREERARFASADGEHGSSPVEPLSNYFVARMRRDLNQGRTALGGIATATNRQLDHEILRPLLRHSAYVAGVDGEHSFPGRVWTLSGFLTASQVHGSESAIAASQRSSVRYLQRPDATHLSFDSTRTSLSGHAAGFAVRRMGAWRGSMVYQRASPGFETNELGFQSRADVHAVGILFGHDQSRPTRLLRSRFIRGFATQRWNFGGELLDASYALRTSVTLHNMWGGSVTTTYRPPALDDRVLRGGPFLRRPSAREVTATISSDNRRSVSGTADVAHSRDADGGSFAGGSISLTGLPASHVQITLSPALERQHTHNQYVMQRADALAGATFGRRYVLGSLDQTTASLGARVDWTFSPTLTFQLFARPFLSHGRYDGFKELQQPRTNSFFRYGVDGGSIVRDEGCDGSSASGRYAVNPGAGAACFTFADPDFIVRSLRGNAVVRWEYRPGSTLFLVWQQERSGAHDLGDVWVGRDLLGVFDAPPRNVLLVKATFWVGR